MMKQSTNNLLFGYSLASLKYATVSNPPSLMHSLHLFLVHFFIISSTWAATRKRKARSAVGWILSSTIRIKLPSAWLRKILTAVDCCKQLQPVNALCILRMLQNRPSEFLGVNNRFRHQIHNSKSFIHYYDLITSGVINMLIMLLTQLSKDVHDSIPSILGIQPPR